MLGAGLGQPPHCPLRPPVLIIPLMLLLHSGTAHTPAAVSAEPQDSGSSDQVLALKSQLATGPGNGALQSGGVTVQSC